MPRQLKTKAPIEHLETLLKMSRQIAADDQLSKERIKKIQKHLSAAMSELQQEMGR
jgi:hypothetical protein